jgi:hypothetical protein
MAGRPYTICVLCYGEFPDLHRRCIGSILAYTPMETYELRVGLNDVCQQTIDYLMGEVQDRLGDQLLIFNSENNIRKYPLMRQMFHREAEPIQSPWVIWFDDDSYVESGKWMKDLDAEIGKNPETAMFGAQYYIHLRGHQEDWIKAAKWYQGEQLQIDEKKGLPKVDFITGGWWALQTKWIQMLDWPDPRINHNGGDVALGEALRQNNGKCRNFKSGIQINQAKRRGFREEPAGYHGA